VISRLGHHMAKKRKAKKSKIKRKRMAKKTKSKKRSTRKVDVLTPTVSDEELERLRKLFLMKH
jgi:hypothetical protein